MGTVEQRILAMLEENGVQAKELMKMDLVMKDKVIYPVSTLTTNYQLFSEITNTGKDAFSRTHKFPLQRGKIFTIAGVRAINNIVPLVTGISTTNGYNIDMFEQDSYFEFKVEKTTLNPIYLSWTTPNTVAGIAAAGQLQTPRQDWNAYYFSEQLIVPFSGDIALQFVPRTGITTAATVATNPFYMNGSTGTEGFSINVQLICQEWTIIQ